MLVLILEKISERFEGVTFYDCLDRGTVPFRLFMVRLVLKNKWGRSFLVGS